MRILILLTLTVIIFSAHFSYAEKFECSANSTEQTSEPENSEKSNSCSDNEDPRKRWDELQEEKRGRAKDPEKLKEYCTKCYAKCLKAKNDTSENDPLKNWICIQCDRECEKDKNSGTEK